MHKNDLEKWMILVDLTIFELTCWTEKCCDFVCLLLLLFIGMLNVDCVSLM